MSAISIDPDQAVYMAANIAAGKTFALTPSPLFQYNPQGNETNNYPKYDVVLFQLNKSQDAFLVSALAAGHQNVSIATIGGQPYLQAV
jgi:hypothetical protein